MKGLRYLMMLKGACVFANVAIRLRDERVSRVDTTVDIVNSKKCEQIYGTCSAIFPDSRFE